jgi:hypothetical protein
VRKWRQGRVIVLGTMAVVAVPPMPLNAEDFDAGKSAPQLFASDLFKLSSHALRSGEAHDQLVAR